MSSTVERRASRPSGSVVAGRDARLSTGTHHGTMRGFLGEAFLAILVVGGAGYIGSHAARGLRGAGENPQKYVRNNVAGGLSLLNCVLEAGIRRFVFSSSCAVYGRSRRQPIPEATAREPLNPYGASKLFFENALEAYGRAYGLRSVSLRYFNAAGADESGEIGEMHHPETHLIPLALAATTANGPELQVPVLQIYGSDYPTPDGTCVRDYIHVNDLADAHVRALQHLEGDGDENGGDSLVVNLGTGGGYSVLEVIQAVENATGHRVRRTIGPRRPGDPPVLVADPAKAQGVLGWTAKSNLAAIVASAWAWMEKTSQAAGWQQSA